MVITLEIKDFQDLAIIEQLAKRLGWSYKTNESTEYLFGSEANKKFLLEEMAYVDNGGELITMSVDELKTELFK